jgi:hypothetical protein
MLIVKMKMYQQIILKIGKENVQVKLKEIKYVVAERG